MLAKVISEVRSGELLTLFASSGYAVTTHVRAPHAPRFVEVRVSPHGSFVVRA